MTGETETVLTETEKQELFNNNITKPGGVQINNNEKMSILTYFTILHMLFPNEFTSGNSENIKTLVRTGGIRQIPKHLIPKTEHFEDLRKRHPQSWIDFFNKFINNHYKSIKDDTVNNISSIETIGDFLTGENNQNSIPILIEASKLYFEQLKNLLNDANLLVLGKHPLSNIKNLYIKNNTGTVIFNETPDNYNTIILVILISELIAINNPDYIKTIFMNAATEDGKSSSAEARQDGQPGSADGESSSAEAQQNVQQDSADGQPGSADGVKKQIKDVFYASVNKLPAKGKSAFDSVKKLKGDMSQLNSMNAAKSFCQNLLDNTKKIETELNTNLQTQFGITINTDDTVSNEIISDIVTYIEMITNEKQLESNKLNTQDHEGGKKSRKKRRKKTRKKKKQTKKRKTKRYKKPTRRRK